MVCTRKTGRVGKGVVKFILVSEHRFRRFCKKAPKRFCKRILKMVFDIHCICI